MRMNACLTTLCCLASLGVWGCNGGGVAVHYREERRPPRRTYVHVDAGHVCGPGCGHYWSGDRYVVIRDHVHGPGCGHVLHDGRWIVYRGGPTRVQVHKSQPAPEYRPAPGPRPRPPAAHIHGGPQRVGAEHVHGPRCGCVYDRRGNKWQIIGKDHVHGPGCGHVYVEGRWTIRY